MARTKQAARKSTRGKAPPKQKMADGEEKESSSSSADAATAPQEAASSAAEPSSGGGEAADSAPGPAATGNDASGGETKKKEDDPFCLKVKAEYILEKRSPALAPPPPDPRDRNRTEEGGAGNGGDDRKDNNRDDKKERRKKNRGQNKKRPRDARTPNSEKLCRAVARGEECKWTGKGKCKFSHDIKGYLADRPPDLEVEGGCPNFALSGSCEFGLMCRVGACHINLATGENLTKEVKEKSAACGNELKKDVQIQLRKNKYPFKCKRYNDKGKGNPKIKKEEEGEGGATMRTENNSGEAEKGNPQIKKEVEGEGGEKMETENDGVKAEEPDLSPLPSKTRPIIDFRNKVYVAPLTTVGNLPFRRIMKRFGADITCGEMALATGLLSGKHSEWSLVRRHPSEDVFGVQIAAGYPDQFMRCCELIENECDVDFVDINMGCPIDLVCDKGGGAALMLREKKLKACLEGISGTLSCPFTMKIRTGWEEEKPFAHTLVPKVQGWEIPGLSAVMIHGRSRLQRYTKLANWDYISKVATSQSSPDSESSPPRLPLIGNGDIFSYTDYEEKVSREGVETTAMLARGALIKPWLPTEIKERRHWDISASERLDVLKDFVRWGLEHWGTDQQGVNNTRRFLLEWLSFLYRYVPVGLLEVLPQQMNQRPPLHMCGRSDLETIMMSRNSADWIKISEMLLGPVPDGFRFEPKHKANSYKAA